MEILSNRRRTAMFSVILVSTILSSMLLTALTTALPAIMVDFDITASLGQWLTSIYNLVMGISMLCAAYLSKRFPTKKLYFGALTIFTVGIFIDLFAPGFTLMMLGRILQAAGNGIIIATAQVVLLTIYPAEKHGSIMGIYGLATAAAPIFAPTLAGLLVDFLHWRMIFVIAGVICILALIGTAICFKNVLETSTLKLDLLSAILCAVAFCGITLGVGNISSSNILSMQVAGIFSIGIIAVIIFVFRQKKLPTPFLDISVFSNKEFRVSVIGSMIMYLIMMAASMLYPLQLQTVCGYGATTSALVNIPGSLLMSLSNPFIGNFYNKLGAKKLFISGSVCLLVFASAFSTFTLNTSLIAICIFTIIRCLGISLIMMPMVTYSVSTLPKENIAPATSLLSSLRTVSGSIGSAVFVAFATIGSKGVLNMRGLNFSYKILTVCACALLLIAGFGMRKTKNSK